MCWAATLRCLRPRTPTFSEVSRPKHTLKWFESLQRIDSPTLPAASNVETRGKERKGAELQESGHGKHARMPTHTHEKGRRGGGGGERERERERERDRERARAREREREREIAAGGRGTVSTPCLLRQKLFEVYNAQESMRGGEDNRIRRSLPEIVSAFSSRAHSRLAPELAAHKHSQDHTYFFALHISDWTSMCTHSTTFHHT